MKPFVLSCLIATTALAQVRGEYLFSTNDGRTIQGRVLSETQSGYLVATSTGTQVVVFSSIADMHAVTATPSAAPLPTGPRPGVVTATPETYAEVSDRPEAAGSVDGFHVGLGAGLMLLPTDDPTFTLNAQVNLDWVSGHVGFRLSPGVWLYSRGTGFYVAPELDAKFMVYAGRVYSFGVGLDFGLAIGGYTQGYLGASLAPVILRFGSQGQHQVALQISVPFFRMSGINLANSSFGLPMTSLGYTYRF